MTHIVHYIFGAILCFRTKDQYVIILLGFHKTAPRLYHISSSYTEAGVMLSVSFKSWLWQSLAVLSSVFWMKSSVTCSSFTAEFTGGFTDCSEQTWSVSKPRSWRFCGKYWSTTAALLVSESSWSASSETAAPLCAEPLSPLTREADWDTALTSSDGSFCLPSCSAALIAGLLSRPKKLLRTT